MSLESVHSCLYNPSDPSIPRQSILKQPRLLRSGEQNPSLLSTPYSTSDSTIQAMNENEEEISNAPANGLSQASVELPQKSMTAIADVSPKKGDGTGPSWNDEETHAMAKGVAKVCMDVTVGSQISKAVMERRIRAMFITYEFRLTNACTMKF